MKVGLFGFIFSFFPLFRGEGDWVVGLVCEGHDCRVSFLSEYSHELFLLSSRLEALYILVVNLHDEMSCDCLYGYVILIVDGPRYPCLNLNYINGKV